MPNLVIIGTGETADIAFKCFQYDSDYEVVGFAVERKYYDTSEFNNRRVYVLENLKGVFNTTDIDVFVAVSSVNNNKERERIYNVIIGMGYNCASYICSKSIISQFSCIGKNVLVLEGVVIQKDACIGNNTIIWNGVQIAHRTQVKDNCWLAPSCTLCGFVTVEKNSFIGAGAVIIDNVVVKKESLIGAGAVLCRDTNKEGYVYVGVPAKVLKENR